LDLGVYGYQSGLFQADMINQIKEREEELEHERQANRRMKRELDITKHRMEQMKAEAPKKAFKPEIGANFDQDDINKFFK
jgi:hypothetical protein